MSAFPLISQQPLFRPPRSPPLLEAELLLAFIATDYLSGSNTTVIAVSGVGIELDFSSRDK